MDGPFPLDGPFPPPTKRRDNLARRSRLQRTIVRLLRHLSETYGR